MVSKVSKQGGPEFKVSLSNLSQKEKAIIQKLSTMTARFKWKREASNKFIQKESHWEGGGEGEMGGWG